ncbi:4-(cytidine 5'-diphospho)-2-C-methyl-D-erythritol kinase, partial [Rhizobium sp. TRM95111]|uniref:4-(cytidine 5'-diphospho)-2-C-methyl-D-erythritol kinase n=1 Tax=Rhizobium alarense TaxID=2846851 RepID=UPI001F29F773
SAGGDNLVLRARDVLRRHLVSRGRPAPGVAIHLEKNLPVASGIGGGSADAAAALRGLLRLWHAGVDERTLAAIALTLGADVPMCLLSRPLIARGIGEDITPLPDMPVFPMVLANPMTPVSTPAVFGALAERTNPPVGAVPQAAGAAAAWIAALGDMRNDLEPPARTLCPAIGDVADALSRSGAALVRMSGSGATCFALYATHADAASAAETIARQEPGWFVAATRTRGGSTHGTP